MSELIIPCYLSDDEGILKFERLLTSIKNQTLPFSAVHVIDDASPRSAEGLTAVHGYEYTRLNKNSGPAKARNHGIRCALERGTGLLFFTDHDCVLDNNWNLRLSQFMASSNFGAAGGRTLAFGRTIYDYYHDINGTLNGKWLLPDRKELWYMPSLNFCMKAETAKEFEFDERFPTAAGEDVDLCLRLRSKYKIGFCPEAFLWHDFGYTGKFGDFRRFIELFKKYKSSSATLYEGHTVLLWDASESIYHGNAYEPNLWAPLNTHSI